MSYERKKYLHKISNVHEEISIVTDVISIKNSMIAYSYFFFLYLGDCWLFYSLLTTQLMLCDDTYTFSLIAFFLLHFLPPPLWHLDTRVHKEETTLRSTMRVRTEYGQSTVGVRFGVPFSLESVHMINQVFLSWTNLTMKKKAPQ